MVMEESRDAGHQIRFTESVSEMWRTYTNNTNIIRTFIDANGDPVTVGIGKTVTFLVRKEEDEENEGASLERRIESLEKISHNETELLDTKTGTVITDENGARSIIFATPFADINYAISFACEVPADTVVAMWLNKTVNGFDIKTEDDGGKAEPNVVVDWIAVAFNNP